VNAAPRPKRYVLRAIGYFAIAVAGIALGTVASAHHLDGLNGLAVGIVGIALALAMASLARAYKTKVPVPRQARRLIAMSEAMDAGQPLSGKFRAVLRDPTQGVPVTVDWIYTDMTLSLPSSYKGENVRVMTLRSGGIDLELAAPAQLIEIIRYSLARTTPGDGAAAS
jgi:hypothetical protein